MNGEGLEGGRRKGGRHFGPGMVLGTAEERELAASRSVIFPAASCFSPPPPLPV